MSFVNVIPEAVSSAAGNLESIGSELNAAHAAAAEPTTGVPAMAADEVSAAVQSAFATYARGYQAASAQAAAFHSRLVALTSGGAVAYAEAEMSNARDAVSAELAAAAQPARAEVAAARQAAKTDAVAARRVMRAEAKVAKQEVAGMVDPLAEKYLGRPLIRIGDTPGTTGGGSTQGSSGSATTSDGSNASGANTDAGATAAAPGNGATPVAKQAISATATGSTLSDAASATQGAAAMAAPASATATAATATATAATAVGTAVTGTPGDVAGGATVTGGTSAVTATGGSVGSGNATTTTGPSAMTGSGNATVGNGSVSSLPPITEANVKTPLGPVQVTLDQSLAPDGTTSWSGSVSMPPALADAVDAVGAQLSATSALHTDVAAFTAAMQAGHPVAAVHYLLRAPGDVAHAYLYGQTAITEPLPAPSGYAEAYATVPTGGLLSPLQPPTVTLVPSTGSPTVVTLSGAEFGGVATSLKR